MYRPHTRCRCCSKDNLTPVFDLGVQPLANAFAKSDDERPGFYPLQVLFCEACTLAQLSVTVNPAVLYHNYPYITSRSRTMREHFELLWRAITAECQPDSVAEIGSNDGYLLQFLKEKGVDRVLGIDPAENLSPKPDSGIISICGLFDAQSAAIAHRAMPDAKVIIARHVFAHINDLNAFVKNLDTLANQDTLIVIEVPYVMDILAGVELDTIYHEHLSYVSVRAIVTLLETSPFHIHKVLRFEIHGGAIVLMLRRNDHDSQPNGSIDYYLSREKITVSTWIDFAVMAHRKIDALRRFVATKIYGGNASVCGFGASAKSTVWINACGFSEREIKFICDCTPSKQGRFSPGSRIPILPESALLEKQPGFAICFAWNFAKEIMENNQPYLEAGGRFVIPGQL